jgi:hypothetical protein
LGKLTYAIQFHLTHIRIWDKVTRGRTAILYSTRKRFGGLRVVMRQLVRTTSVWAFAALFGCISLLGPGWHCVFGHHFHGPAACGHGTCHAHPHPAARAESATQAVASDCAAASDAAAERSFSALPDADHDCPLCQFFGAAQWAEAIPPPELAQLPRALATPPTNAVRLTFVSLYQSRGPPLHPARV